MSIFDFEINWVSKLFLAGALVYLAYSFFPRTKTLDRTPSKKWYRLMFEYTWINYLITAILCLLMTMVIFSVILGALSSINIALPFGLKKFIGVSLFACSVMYVYKQWQLHVDVNIKLELLCLKSPTMIWPKPGIWFVPFFGTLFSMLTHEPVDTEVGDVQCEIFPATDADLKDLLVDASGDVRVIDTDEAAEKHRKFKAPQMRQNLMKLLQKTTEIELGTRNYKTQILGKELHDIVLNNPTFKKECAKFGMEFISTFIAVRSANRAQDDANRFEEQLFEKYKQRYPNPSKLTRDDLKRIQSDVQAQLGKAEKFIVEGNSDSTLGKYEMGKKVRSVD